MDKWERQNRRQIADVEKAIDRIYREAVAEAARIGASVSGFDPEKPFSFSASPAARNRVKGILNKLKSDLSVAIVNGVDSAWTLANNKNNELCRVVFGDNAGKLSEEQYRRYYTSNDKAREAFKQRKTSGLGLSDRVWNYTDQFKNELEMGIDIGLRDGLSGDEMSRQLRQYLKYPDKLFRRVRDEHGVLHLSKAAKAFHPGQGVYRSSYKNARRLAATETNIAYRTSDYMRYQQLDFVVGIRVVLSGNHTILNSKGEAVPFEDICDELSAPEGSTNRKGRGCYPKDFRFTGWHPHCRCHVETILKTEAEMREDDRRIMAGLEPASPTTSKNYVGDVPQEFKKWTENNADRIAHAKSLPYFIRDNEAYFPQMRITKSARAGVNEAQAFNAKIDDYNAHPSELTIRQIGDAVSRGEITLTNPLLTRGQRLYQYSRVDLQNQIISEYLKGYNVRSDTVYMLGGATANGKSTLVESGLLPHPKGALVIDSDKVKAMIPEYKAMLESKDKNLINAAANFVHEESSEIAKTIQENAMSRGLATVLDGINNGSADKVAEKVAIIRAQSGGKRIRADYVSLDTELSFKLAEARARKTGRDVPQKVIAKSNRGVSAMMPEVIERKLFDELYLWDTNVNGTPRLILKQIDGVLTIENRELYNRFLKKAKE